MHRIRSSFILIAFFCLGSCTAEEKEFDEKEIIELKSLLTKSPSMEFEPKPFPDRPKLIELLKAHEKLAVPTLSQLIKSENLETAAGAAWALGELGDKEAVPVLIEMLGKEPAGLSIAVSGALGKIDDPELVGKLVELALAKEGDIAVSAMTALEKFTLPKYVARLTPLLKHKETKIRASAAQGLGHIGSKDAVPALIAALNDNNDGVVMLTAQSLGAIGDASAVDALNARLDKGGDLFLRRYLVDAVRAIADKGGAAWIDSTKVPPGIDGVPFLIKALSDHDAKTRKNAATALKNRSDLATSAVPALVELFADDNENVRNAALEAVIAIGKPSIPTLGAALKESDERILNKTLVALLRILVDKEAIEEVRVVLPDILKFLDHKSFQATVFHFINYLGPAAVIAAPKLIPLLQSENQNVAYSAALALGSIGKPALANMLKALKDQNAVVRRRAAFALGQIGVLGKVMTVQSIALQHRPDLDSMDSLRLESAEDAVPELVTALSDDDAGVRAMAATSLGRMKAKSKDAQSALGKCNDDKDEIVRKAAEKAMAKIKASQGKL